MATSAGIPADRTRSSELDKSPRAIGETAYAELEPGQAAPWFVQRSTSRPRFAFDSAAGRYLVLCFFGSAGDPQAQRRLAVAHQCRPLFDDERIMFFGVSIDPTDEQSGRVSGDLPGIRHFWDFDGCVSRLYGALPSTNTGDPGSAFRARWVVLDPGLRVVSVLPFGADDTDIRALAELLVGLPPVTHFGGLEMHAPVLVLPRVFEPSLCRQLIERYDGHGGAPTGVMREVDGFTIAVQDTHHKVRSDIVVEESTWHQRILRDIARNVLPAIELAFQFKVTRMERFLIGCYDSGNGGHFRAHRDNTTRGTAHRRFALSINLNDDFDGGELVFPEFGPRRYKVPAGAGVVFGCSLLHAVTPVTRGRRYAFLPFLYDEQAAAIRESNRCSLATSV